MARGSLPDRAWLDVGAVLGGRGGRVGYAALVLDAQTDGARYLMLGSDDGLSAARRARGVASRVAAALARRPRRRQARPPPRPSCW
ncbi:MAG: hypothetical protein U0326_41085 [Polyangiales bacterium]